MAEQGLVVENQVLQFAAFDRHDHRLVDAVERGQDPLRALFELDGPVLGAIAYAQAAAEAAVLDQRGVTTFRLMRVVGRAEGDRFDRTDVDA